MTAFNGTAPQPPLYVVERSRIAAALAGVTHRRLTAVTAGAGYGKTTALVGWMAGRRAAWYTVTAADRDPAVLGSGLLASLAGQIPALGSQLAAALTGPRGTKTDPHEIARAISAELHANLDDDFVLVLDDLHELDGSGDALALLGGLCQVAPARLHLLVASRNDLAVPIGGLGLAGQVRVVTAELLGFDDVETRGLLDALGGTAVSAFTGQVHWLTGGWPAAVRLVGEALAGASDPAHVLTNFTRHGGPAALVHELLAAELATHIPVGLLEVLRTGTALRRFDVELLRVLGVPGPGNLLAPAARRGIHLIADPSVPGWYCLTPMTKEYVLAAGIVTEAEQDRIRSTAARWHAGRGDWAVAAEYLSEAGDLTGLAELLTDQGSALVNSGHSALVARVIAAIPADLRSAAIDLVDGEASQIRGDWDWAVACMSRLVPSTGPAPAAAWRLGMIQHMRGQPATALETYRQALADPDGSTADRTMAAAWGSAAAYLIGDVALCRELAATADAMARPANDARALSVTHTAWAMLAALEGDRRRNDMHYARALDYAGQVNDVLQLVRIRVNRGSRLLEEGHYVEAVAELDTAIALADLSGYASLGALALCNRGAALRRTGRLEDAVRDYDAALAVYQRLGSGMAAYALSGLGDVHLDRGSLSLARGCFEEAAALAESTGDLQALVPALAGLAMASVEDDPPAATALAARAVACGPSLGQCGALLASAWVAARTDRNVEARAHAEAAAALARERRDRAGLAEALELRSIAATSDDLRRRLLMEAESLWIELACPISLARTQLAIVRANAADDPGYLLTQIDKVARELGARGLGRDLAILRAKVANVPAPAVVINALGGFQVYRGGIPVPHTDWQSRKARDLLKILIARRGVAVSREVIAELLWPEADPARSSARLSTALSTLRSVLDPDKAHPPDHYVTSVEGAMRLRREHVELDTESFLRRVESAGTGIAVDELSAIEALYTGDFCEEDPYADWATGLRDEARSAYVALLRTLASQYAERGDHDPAARCLSRLLVHDPYDEQAHLMLVQAFDHGGRHGDARRMYATYTERMVEIDILPAPYPDAVRAVG